MTKPTTAGRTTAASPTSNGSTPDSVAWERLDDQLGWYEAKSAGCKRAFQRLKLVQIVVAAAIPASVALGASAALAGVLGAVIVVVEGVQQLFQYQQSWTGYRATAEALKHERFLYLSHAGPYRGADRDAVLAEHVEARVSTEHAAWIAEQREQAAATRVDP